MSQISIFLAGIRPQNWTNLYNSVRNSTSKEFELIFVGPYDPVDNILDNKNVQYIKDHGSSSRCYQLGLLASKYEYVTWAADDGHFLSNLAIDKAFDVLKGMGDSHKNIVSFKYFEGGYDDSRKTDIFWRMGSHEPIRAKFIPPQYYLLMNGLMYKDYLLGIGGWDCQFESHGIATCDLAVRVQNDGAKIHMLNEPFMHVSHCPNTTGDHAPVHFAHIEHDEPLFRDMYNNPIYSERKIIDIDNWNKAPAVWKRRFS